uniref:SANT domain-containing protein n=1 Tax=Ganoderma boninense TaxID=34458 RepID=A0A5K1JX65_9APHY|nr:SANT domain-containing protein [Ganoderma boninense]
MSQRVQKGSTVFRPVARPRARPAAESRQSSVLPEATPGPSRSQDNVVQQVAPMPPPPVVYPRPPVEPNHSHPATPALQDGISHPRETLTPQPFSTSAHTSSVTVASSAVRNSSRMPPTVGSTQHPSGHSALPDPLPMTHAPPAHPPRSTVSSAPQTVPPLHRLLEHNSSLFDDYRAMPPPLPNHLAAVHFPVDGTQIDPQLMGIVGLGPPGVPYASHTLDNRPMSPENAPVTKNPRSRRSRRRRSEVDASGAEAASLGEGGSAGPSKRRRSRKKDAEGNADVTEPRTKNRKLSSSESRSDRPRTRQPSLPPFDPEADPGEELDPTVVTMAALCDDTGKGRVSTRAAQIVSNHAAWRTSNREKRTRMKAIMEAKKYGRNPDEEEESAARAVPDSQTGESTDPVDPGSTSRSGTPAVNEDATRRVDGGTDGESGTAVDGFDYTENLAVSRYNVQVRIGANGETIIDEDSLFVNRDEEHQTEDYAHVEESDFTKFVNSSTYSKKARGSRWSAEETELFFDALSQFGENYELISYVLPGRDRKACKNKFKSEDKKNPARITFCLANRKPYDIATLARMTGKDFSGPTPEIRAPTPVRSTELPVNGPTTASPRSTRKKSRTPSVHDPHVEIVGGIDEFDKDDAGIDT